MATRVSDTWQTVFNIINSIDYTHPHLSKYIYSSFPDVAIRNKEYYPLIVIQSPEFRQEEHGYSNVENSVRMTIEIYATSAETRDQLADKIISKIEESRSTLESNNLYRPVIVSMSDMTYSRGGMKIHLKRLVYEFKMVYER